MNVNASRPDKILYLRLTRLNPFGEIRPFCNRVRSLTQDSREKARINISTTSLLGVLRLALSRLRSVTHRSG